LEQKLVEWRALWRIMDELKLSGMDGAERSRIMEKNGAVRRLMEKNG
jgi:hypothetical protein